MKSCTITPKCIALLRKVYSKHDKKNCFNEEKNQKKKAKRKRRRKAYRAINVSLHSQRSFKTHNSFSFGVGYNFVFVFFLNFFAFVFHALSVFSYILGLIERTKRHQNNLWNEQHSIFRLPLLLLFFSLSLKNKNVFIDLCSVV